MSETLTPAQARHKHKATFDRFWMAYPRKTHINDAANSWARLMESGADPVKIVKAATSFAGKVGPDLQYCPGPHRWLEGGRYEDADLFEDESAARIAWLKQMWQEANVRAVENRFHISMEKEYPPDSVTAPEAIRFWHKQRARSWITSVAISKGATPKNGETPSDTSAATKSATLDASESLPA